MNMSNQDLDWLAAQPPQRLETDPGARERALQALVQHTTCRPGGPGLSLRRVLRTRTLGLAATTGAAALAAALVLSVGGSGGGAAGAGRLGQRVRPPQAALHHPGTVSSPLVRLADYVSGSGPPAGNATLVARTTTTGSGNSVTVYDLYADNGQYFFSQAESGLAGQVSGHHNIAGGLFAREIAAANLGATGDVQTAAQDMADAPDPSHVISPTQSVNRAAIAAKQAATGSPQAGDLFDNWVWENSQDALIAGSGRPQVRAGVLRILATLPGVNVTHGTSAAQPTLVLTAGTPELGAGYSEQLTINADTGVPIQFIGGPPGGTPAATVDYAVSRVTLGNLPSGT
jgi:hypothetical protein